MSEDKSRQYSQSEVHEIVSNRLAEQVDRTWNQQVDRAFGEIRTRLDDANHLKENFGHRLDSIDTKLEPLAFLGIEQVGPDERGMLPSILRAAFTAKQSKPLDDARSAKRQAVVATAAAVVVAACGLVALLLSLGVIRLR